MIAPKNATKENRAKLSIVTVNYRTPHHVRNLLKSVEDIDPEIPFEFFLVDNASGDGSTELIQSQFPWVRLIELEENVGFGRGNNAAIEASNGEYLFICNPDLVLDRGEIEKWVAWMDEHPDVGISGPRLLNPDGSDQASCYRFPKLYTPALRRMPLGRIDWVRAYNDHYTMSDHDRSRETDVDWILGAALMIRRSAMNAFGAFDPSFFLYFEDTDICRRAWEHGFRVTYTPAAKCTHYHARGSVTTWPWEALTNKVTRIHIKSAVQYFWKHRGKPLPR